LENRLKPLGILKRYPGSIDQIVDLINDRVVQVVRVLEVNEKTVHDSRQHSAVAKLALCSSSWHFAAAVGTLQQQLALCSSSWVIFSGSLLCWGSMAALGGHDSVTMWHCSSSAAAVELDFSDNVAAL
jgi:hypothetical protein